MKIKGRENLPKALILALADPVKQARLRTICYRLKELDDKSKPHNYWNDEKSSWLDMVQYGVAGIKFSKINTLFEKLEGR